MTYAEAANELSGPSDEIYGYLNQIRQRVGMREVDKAKYGTKDKLRELIRRERTVELAGEGLRRADIVRWQEDGKMLAEKVLNGDLLRVTGTINYGESEPTKRAEITVRLLLRLVSSLLVTVTCRFLKQAWIRIQT